MSKGVIMSKQLKDLLWKFGVWDDLTDQQHVELQRFIDQYAYEYAERVISNNLSSDDLDDLESVEQWPYYNDYGSNANDFIKGYNKRGDEIRTRNQELSPHRATKGGVDDEYS
jgi:hypothetical protein